MRKLIFAIIMIAIPACLESFNDSEANTSSETRSQEELFALCDSLAMEVPVIRPFTKADKVKYSVKALDYGMTIGIERTPKGRIWNCFVGGGDNADSFFLLNWSDDGGKKWTDVKFIIDPHSDGHPLKRRTIVGQLWTDPELFQPHIDSRHFMIILASGNILLVRHGMTDEKTNKRSHMRAFISSDKGNTWQGGLLIDERAGVSYPTGFQDEEGYVTISYDYERTKCGELYLAKFNEEDILACAIVSNKGYLGKMFYKPGRVEYSKANLNDKKSRHIRPTEHRKAGGMPDRN